MIESATFRAGCKMWVVATKTLRGFLQHNPILQGGITPPLDPPEETRRKQTNTNSKKVE
jgi:hypothetical protein